MAVARADALTDDVLSEAGTPISPGAPHQAGCAQEQDAVRAFVKTRLRPEKIRLHAGVLRTQSSDDESCNARGEDGGLTTVIEVDFPTRLRRRSRHTGDEASSPTRRPPPNRSPQRHSPTSRSPTRHSPTRPRQDGCSRNRTKMCSALDMEEDPVRPELSSAAVPAARRNRAKMCSALDMERVWEGDPVLPALGSSSGDGACEALCVPAVLAARRNRVKMCSALDTEDDLVLPARCSVKPCSSIDQDDDEAVCGRFITNSSCATAPNASATANLAIPGEGLNFHEIPGQSRGVDTSISSGIACEKGSKIGTRHWGRSTSGLACAGWTKRRHFAKEVADQVASRKDCRAAHKT